MDGTFATPALQQPLALGADVVLHSTTKYIGGHSDVQGGALVFKRRDDPFHRLIELRSLLGAVASPFNSWLVLRGLRTLAVRVERQSANAMALAAVLDGHPRLGGRPLSRSGLASRARDRAAPDARLRRHALDPGGGRPGAPRSRWPRACGSS